MAKKMAAAPKIAAKSEVSKTPVIKAATAVSSPVRNTPIPRVAVAKKEITHADIAKRAYEISRSPACGTETDNWLRAERELRAAF